MLALVLARVLVLAWVLVPRILAVKKALGQRGKANLPLKDENRLRHMASTF